MRILAALLALASACLGDPRTNLLLISVDDMNRDSVGAYGCPIPGLTPHIDRLAAEGIRFDRGFVNVAICQPCRAVWMTGRYPQNNGALGFEKISPEVPTLPETLGKAGYFTALIGKAKHVVPSRHHAFDRIRDPAELGHGRDPRAYAEAVRQVIDAAGNRPFFIMANAHDPHRPFAGSAAEKFRPRPKVRRTLTGAEAVIPPFLPDLPPIRRELAEYFTSVHRADEVVGAVLAEIGAAGVAERTLVLFVSDHGMPLPFAKTNCYPASNAIPWIMRWPGRIPAATSDARHFVSGIDLAPTLLDAAGLPNLAGADGSSLLPLVAGEPQPGRNHVFTLIQRTSAGKAFPMRAVNDGDFLYIWNGWADGETRFRNESQAGLSFQAMLTAEDPAIRERAAFFLHRCRQEMYDLREDPGCRHNLIAEPNDRWTPRAGAMAKSLWHWMRRCRDPEIQAFQQQVQPPLD